MGEPELSAPLGYKQIVSILEDSHCFSLPHKIHVEMQF